jgi:hypothetical protein
LIAKFVHHVYNRLIRRVLLLHRLILSFLLLFGLAFPELIPHAVPHGSLFLNLLLRNGVNAAKFEEFVFAAAHQHDFVFHRAEHAAVLVVLLLFVLVDHGDFFFVLVYISFVFDVGHCLYAEYRWRTMQDVVIAKLALGRQDAERI